MLHCNIMAYSLDDEKQIFQYPDICAECNARNCLIACTACGRSWHLACLDPPMLTVPEPRWTCTLCKALDVYVQQASDLPSVESVPSIYPDLQTAVQIIRDQYAFIIKMRAMMYAHEEKYSVWHMAVNAAAHRITEKFTAMRGKWEKADRDLSILVPKYLFERAKAEALEKQQQDLLHKQNEMMNILNSSEY